MYGYERHCSNAKVYSFFRFSEALTKNGKQNTRKTYLPIPHLSHNTISFGLSEVPSLQMIHTISAVVSVTVRKQKVALARTKKPNYTFPTTLRKGSFIDREHKKSLIASHMKIRELRVSYMKKLGPDSIDKPLHILLNWIKKLNCKN